MFLKPIFKHIVTKVHKIVNVQRQRNMDFTTIDQ